MGVQNPLWILLFLANIWSLSHQQAVNYPGSGVSGPRDDVVKSIRSKLMYPYEKRDHVDSIDFGNPQINHDYSFPFPFFGFKFNYTYISIHGVVSFSRAPAKMDFPMRFPIDDWPRREDPALIAPFYAHAQVGNADSGTQQDISPPGVYFRYYEKIGTTLRDDLQEQIDIREALRLDIQDGMIGSFDFVPKHVIIVTWRNVTFGGSWKLDITNTYQMIMTTDDVRTYVIFNYDKVRWTTSINAKGTQDGIGGHPAFVGFNAGNGTRAYEYIPYSQNEKIIDLPTYGFINDHPGRHMFRVDEEIIQGSCNFEPDKDPRLFLSPESGHMLGGTIVNITGPCLSDPAKKTITVKFHDVDVDCPYRGRNMATCVTPRIYTAGYIEVSARTDVAGRLFTNKFYIENPMLQTDQIKIDNRKVLTQLEAKQLKLRWSWHNITWDINQPVSISLWGYREYSTKPDLIHIVTLDEGVPNRGYHEIDLEQFQNRDDGWKRDFTFGVIQINTTLKPIPDAQGIALEPTIWSEPIPLGWYFHKQWVRYYGDDWAEQFCEKWDLDDRRLKTFAYQVPRCPCTIEQALADKGRFAPDFGCDKWGNRECYNSQKMLHCVRSGQPSADGGGQQCCYGTEGDLVMNSDMKEGGVPNRAHPFGIYPYDESTKVPGLSHWFHDQSAFMSCCGWQSEMSSSCYQYKWRRASQDCIGYQPPNASVVFGDPHIITYDNFEYTFNGKGEYSLLRVHHEANNLDVQGRFEQLVDAGRKLKLDATILTAVAARDNNSVTVEIQLRPSEARWRYRLNVLVDKKRIYFDRPAQKLQSFRGVTVYSPSDIQNQSHIIAMFQSGAGVEVLENGGYIAARVYLPRTFMNITRGLLGNWSNDPEDDLQPPDSNMPPLPKTSDPEIIYREFGQKWMVTDSGENNVDGSASLFSHENQRTSSTYNDIEFRPNFKREPDWLENMTITKEDLNYVCGSASDPSSYQCRFDYLITQNKPFAQVTKYNAVSFRKMKTDLKIITTCGALETPRHGRKSTNKYTVNTEVKFECDKNYILEGEPVRWCYASGEWSWVEFGITRCLTEDEYSARQAGITAGIILGILIPILVGAACLFCFIVSKKNENQIPRYRESHEMARKTVVEDAEKPQRKYSTEA